MEALDIPRLRGVTHAYAFWLAVVAAVALVAFAPAGAARTAAAVYGVGLCALFGGSGLYHRWRWHPRWRPLLRRVDHSTIYVFIAASYTPVGMLVLSGAVQWIVLVTVWAGAAAGVTLSVAWINAPRSVCAVCYLALGWVAVIALPQLTTELPVIALALIGGGGVLYTIGAIVFALGRPNPWPAVFGFHEIFHVFVILAAVAHFVAMAGWIVPSGLDG
jgi:hemolysin III